MTRIRMKFTKMGNVKFISHLDLSRLMERAFRRAEIPLIFTQGYHPHPKISFATALALGVSSEGEYMDIEIEKPMDLNTLKEQINKQLPKGIQIMECVYIKENAPSLMSVIDYGAYIVRCALYQEFDDIRIIHAIEDFLEQKEIWIEKISKKSGEKKVNIRPFIKEFALSNKDQLQCDFRLIVSTGSKQNIKPEVVVETFCSLFKIPILPEKMRMHRLDLYVERNHQLLTPIEIYS